LIRFLDTSCKEWNEYINKLPKHLRDIYDTREYFKLQEANGDGTAKLFVYEEDNNIAVYPFLMNEIEGYDLDNTYYDIETAYGYGGPITSCNEEDFNRDFEKAFEEFCKENLIVAEFIRFNPLINNHNIFRNNVEVIPNRTTVYVDLNKTIDDIWASEISSKNRNMIRKAEKTGLTVEFEHDLNTFKDIYEKTMTKVNASGYYYFNDKYYKALDELNNVYISVKFNELTIASAIFMQYEDYFHYHLAGSLKEYLKYSPNNLLLWTAIQYAKNNGFKVMHLGGGLSDTLDDNLFKFKKSFGKGTYEFYIGKRIHNKEIYNYLINEWENRNGRDVKLFLQYKL
jgi:lipid II:glycine glycyltransferase (peptidoglycan interpeptide bridge formation enzyme)